MRTICFLCLLLSLTPEVAKPVSNSTFEQILRQQEAAWNRGDGTAWAAVFSDDADFVNLRGLVFHGRKEIARVLIQSLNGTLKGSHATLSIRRITEPAPSVALVDTDLELTHFNMLPPDVVPTSPGLLKIRAKYILTKQGDQWHIVSAQNTVVLPPAPSP
jgi:uncharacterized protein (TIGR02246 family)